MRNKDPMQDFVKALAHADQLKIVGILAQRPARLVEMTESLALPEREISAHLANLEQAGVVHRIGEAFELDTDGLETLARRQFTDQRPSFTPEREQPAERKKILVTYLNPDGTIRQIPNSRTQAIRFRVILEYILAAFEPGASYTEKEVNTIILRFNQDVAGLRRDLVDAGLLLRERDGSRYWRSE